MQLGAHSLRPFHSPARAALRSAALLLVSAIIGAPVHAVELLSRTANGDAGNSASRGVASDGDGSVIAFYSDSTNLVLGDSQEQRDVFVYDAATGGVERISLGRDNEPANRPSHAAGGAPGISRDGNLVTFYSEATNLVDGDSNGVADVFVRIRDLGISTQFGATEIVSVASDGTQANGISLYPSISADGRYVAFQSFASNLVAGDTNGAADVFVHDRDSGHTERICSTVQPDRFSYSPVISADGNSVAFASAATNLVAGDTNGVIDIFVCTRNAADSRFATGSVRRASLSTTGQQGNRDSILPAISGSGCVVVYKSEADNLVPDDRNQDVDVFARDFGSNTTEVISASALAGSPLSDGSTANDGSFPPGISGSGRFVAFGSFATNMLIGDVNGFPSVYVRDRQTGAIRLVDLNDAGMQADRGTPDTPPAVSLDATRIAFVSSAANLAPPGSDRNLADDVFLAVNDIDPPTVETVCCDCSNDTCTVPEDGICPSGCLPVCNANCDEPGQPGFSCTGPTPTPTAEATSTATATEVSTPTETPTLDTSTATPTIDTRTATPTIDSSTSTPTENVGTATPTVDSGTATPTIDTRTSTPTVDSRTPTPTGNGGTATPTITSGTATPVSTVTEVATATRTVNPNQRRRDDDSCAIVAGPTRRSDGLLWLLLPATALLVARRRRS